MRAFGYEKPLLVGEYNAPWPNQFPEATAAMQQAMQPAPDEADSKIDGEWQAAAPGGASAEPGRIGALRGLGVARLGSAMRPG
jgi:hypothetical protein